MPMPPRLIVDRAPDVPEAMEITPVSMSLQWNHSSVTIQSPDLRVVNYMVLYKLSMQQVGGGQERSKGSLFRFRHAATPPDPDARPIECLPM